MEDAVVKAVEVVMEKEAVEVAENALLGVIIPQKATTPV
jgi:hypothetical protein